MAIKVYIIAGGDSTGKTSIIRKICGLRAARKDDSSIVELKMNLNLEQLVYDSKSLQEYKTIYPNEVKAHIDGIAKRAGKTYSAVLIALRTDKYEGMQDAIGYMKEIAKIPDWEIVGVIELVGCLREHCMQMQKQTQLIYQSFSPIPSIEEQFDKIKSLFGIS